MTVGELYQKLEKRIPRALSAEWDNDGMSCCPDPARQAGRVLVALDATAAAVERAVSGGFDVLLTHHPLLFRPLKALTCDRTVPAKLLRLAASGISAMSFHTRLDAMAGGVNDVLAHLLGLADVVPFGPAGEEMGRIGVLPRPMSATEFASLVCRKLGTSAVQLAGEGRVQRVAVLGGEGDDFLSAAAAAGADLFLSGNLGYHRMLDAAEEGLVTLSAGHYATERPVCEMLAATVGEIDPEIKIEIFDTDVIKAVSAEA